MAKEEKLKFYEFNGLELKRERLEKEADEIKGVLKKVELGELKRRLAEIEKECKEIEKKLEGAIS